MDSHLESQHAKLLELLAKMDVEVHEEWIVQDSQPFVKIIIQSNDKSRQYELFLYFMQPLVLQDLFNLSPQFQLLQCAYYAHVPLAKDAQLDIFRLLQMINKVMPLPGFCYDEEEEQILFRWAAPLHSDLQQTLYLIRDMLEIYLEPLLLVASGEVSLDELLHQADLAIGKNLKG